MALLAAVAVASASLFALQPPSGEPPADSSSASAPVPPSAAIRREELEAAIAALRDRIQNRYAGSDDPDELALSVYALGRAALGADPERTLGRLSRGWPAALEASSASRASVSGSAADERPAGSAIRSMERTPVAMLGTLLEAGVSLQQRVPLEGGSSRSLGDLVRAALDAPADPSPEAQAWRLDLTGFATLAGMRDQAPKLGQLAYESLRRLELGYREWNTPRIDVAQGSETLARLEKEFRGGGELEPGAAELHASAATFRAVAVLGGHDLDEPARRHLGDLTYRYRIERAQYAHLLASAADSAGRERVHLAALERLGRLEQALYQAHLSHRTEHRPQPTPELARLMQQVARDLLDHFGQVRGSVLSDALAGSATDRTSALRAAVHALRGLRTARIAI